jgi:hypothetical protein
MFDYMSDPNYETGYFARHARNECHYKEIARRFQNKRTVGVNIFENMSMFKNREFGEDVSRKTYASVGGYMPLVSQWFAVENSLPTVYGESDCASIVFGENAKYVADEMLESGVILDAQAAKILHSKGVDVGIDSFEKMAPSSVEYFPEFDDYITAIPNKEAVAYKFKLQKDAEILSEYLVLDGGFGNYAEHSWGNTERVPACYFYENAKGQRFLVYSFVAETAWGKGVWRKGAFRGYYRQRQLIRGIEMLQRKKLPAILKGAPELYIMCKEGSGGELTVGLWNFFADDVLNPVIELGEKYQKTEFYNCRGTLSGDTVKLYEPIPPYGFAFFTVYK